MFVYMKYEIQTRGMVERRKTLNEAKLFSLLRNVGL